MRARVPALLSIAWLCAACTPAAPPTLVGRYTDSLTARDSPSWRGVVGSWVHEFRPDGMLVITQTGGNHMWIHSRYQFDGEILVLRDLEGSGACTHFGTDTASARYRVKFLPNGLRYEALHDECSPRRYGMTIHPWVRMP